MDKIDYLQISKLDSDKEGGKKSIPVNPDEIDANWLVALNNQESGFPDVLLCKKGEGEEVKRRLQKANREAGTSYGRGDYGLLDRDPEIKEVD